MRPRHRARQVVNYVNLATPLGLLVARLGGARRLRAHDGLLVAHGYRLPIPPAPAFTVGNVIVTRRPAEWLAERPALLAHEARHATQYAFCAGPVLLLPLYLVAAGVSWAATGDLGAWNPFERLAGLEDGGYARSPARWRRRKA
ncbi:hypothetical protein [Bailinhaonella thermotolerans]|uniref:DUF4157 domain-containing protein n=1 Tax=Bailinhaonella thermotolerans TaxID=1070861 RepID=A0A3A4BG04_9ACTN|nr:hypothetical protein [Bailinhaonella thermotolerans]RJL33422.1 hypothetical protein D5H75_11580 [Bailinhaonella thermotolerans]